MKKAAMLKKVLNRSWRKEAVLKNWEVSLIKPRFNKITGSVEAFKAKLYESVFKINSKELWNNNSPKEKALKN